MLNVMDGTRPSWIQIPCREEIIGDWICQKQYPLASKVKGFKNICPKFWNQIDKACIYIDIVYKKDNILEKNSSIYLSHPALHFMKTLYTLFTHTKIQFCVSINECQFKKPSPSLQSWDNNVIAWSHMNNSTTTKRKVYLIKEQRATMVTDCPRGYFQCSDLICISELLLCDGYSNCRESEDELNCTCYVDNEQINDALFCRWHCTRRERCKCNFFYFNSLDHGCIPYQTGNHNTPKHGRKRKDVFLCHDGKNISMSYVNDLVPDCTQTEDEREYTNIVQNNVRTIQDQCNYEELLLPCLFGHSYCFNIHQLCHYDLDEDMNLMTCRNGAHLAKCEQYPCSNSYKCTNSYCIPYRRVCDGRIDCPYHHDEIGCDSFQYEYMLKCASNESGLQLYLHPVEMCDGIIHCPSGDDEALCDIGPCPIGCSCLGQAMKCHHLNLSKVTFMNKELQILSVYDSNIEISNISFSTLSSLRILYLTANEIKEICFTDDIHLIPFQNLGLLNKLDLRYNFISKLSATCFMGLSSLEVMLLQFNNITSISENVFQYVQSLFLLNISHNKINIIRSQGLDALHNLGLLDLRHNNIEVIMPSLASNFSLLHTLYADESWICCMSDTIKVCNATKNPFSSCSYLVRDMWLRVWLWIIAIASLLCNSIVIVSHSSGSIHQFILNNLAFSDMLYGISIGIIVLNDIRYGDHYSINDLTWRRSASCHASSVLSFVSKLMSSILLLWLAVVRFKVITRLEEMKMSLNKYIITLWVVITTLTICTMFYQHVGKGYIAQSNSLCISFILDQSNLSGLINLFYIFIDMYLIVVISMISFLYIKLYIYVHSAAQMVSGSCTHMPQKTAQNLLLHLGMITATNICSYVPIVCCSLLTLASVKVPIIALVAVLTVAMPINAALNPVIYTFTSSTFKRKLKYTFSRMSVHHT